MTPATPSTNSTSGLAADATSVVATAPPIAELRNISKRFGGVVAVDDVGMQVGRDEILGIAGENGSGKSTLVKILSGVHAPDSGEVVFEGRPTQLHDPSGALKHGVALVAQEVQVQPDLTVAENVLFGRLPRRGFGMIDWRATTKAAREVLATLELDLDPQGRLGNLALHQQQMVSIAATLHRKPEVIILDEPTASLPREHVERLFATLRAARARGASIIYITHRLSEYFELCDRIIVLRDGEKVAERLVDETDVNGLVQLMVGRELSDLFVRPQGREAAPAAETPILKVSHLGTRKLGDIDLEVNPGEIVGVAGQAGAGRSTLARSLFGLESYTGAVEIAGAPVTLRSPSEAMAVGIGYVPDDRKGAGLVLTSSVHDNLTLPLWSRLSRRAGITNRRAEVNLVEDAIKQLGIMTSSPDAPVTTLSGGNQQKLVLAKWLARNPKLLILDEPTRGVDVGAKEEIYRLLEHLATDGVAVLVFSSEALELIRLSDRVVVMNSGHIVGEQAGDEATEESLVAMGFRATSEGMV